jgi:hypothetical protein
MAVLLCLLGLVAFPTWARLPDNILHTSLSTPSSWGAGILAEQEQTQAQFAFFCADLLR